MIRVFIGYDPREALAYHVLAHSILQRASRPVTIAPVRREHLARVYTRQADPRESTEFSLRRFLVPYLCGYAGWAIFMDCDMLVQDDIVKLWELQSDAYAVMCCPHDYTPRTAQKMRGAVQTRYEKKNWSSLMLMNTARCQTLTPEYVNTASGLELHQFKWLQDDSEIGYLPLAWNWLVGEYTEVGVEPSCLHYTLGGPWWREFNWVPFAEHWQLELDSLLADLGARGHVTP